MVVTDDQELAELARMLRAHGSRRKYANEMLGYNSRLDELQAAVLRVRMRHLDRSRRARGLVAARYNEMLAGMANITIPNVAPQAEHVYHQYTVRIADGRRDTVAAALAEAGVDTMVYYPVPCHRLPIYSASNRSLPVSERAAASVLSLPIGPALGEAEQAVVVRALAGALGK